MDAARVIAVKHNGLTPSGLTAPCSRCDTAAVDNACAEGQKKLSAQLKICALSIFDGGIKLNKAEWVWQRVKTQKGMMHPDRKKNKHCRFLIVRTGKKNL